MQCIVEAPTTALILEKDVELNQASYKAQNLEIGIEGVLGFLAFVEGMRMTVSSCHHAFNP